MVMPRRQEQRQHDRGHDQQADQRHAADQLDEAHAQALDQRQVGAPAERQQDAVGEGEDQAVGGEDHRHRDAAPQAGLDVAERRDGEAPGRQDARRCAAPGRPRRWRRARARRSSRRRRRCALRMAMPMQADDQRHEQEQAERDVDLAEHQQEGDERAEAPDRSAAASSTCAGRPTVISMASMATTANSGRHCCS